MSKSAIPCGRDMREICRGILNNDMRLRTIGPVDAMMAQYILLLTKECDELIKVIGDRASLSFSLQDVVEKVDEIRKLVE